MKHACHVTTSVATTTQYTACDPFQWATSSLKPRETASPTAASTEAIACITACTSTARMNPPETASRYTSSMTGRYAEKSPAAQSVTM
uniref:Uncharacterized protein n=1 Tax=Triticum urartu TaxID=4572 RepID=A0A8R7P3N4_TRIUA